MKFKSVLMGGVTLAAALTTAAVAQSGSTTIHPEKWPAGRSVGLVDPKTEAFITDLMRRMTLEEKVGQMVQADLSSITPDDLKKYPLGSILAGGGAPPLSGNERGPLSDWVKTAQAYRAANAQRPANHPVIPLIFGVDALHGNNNVVGAVIFPHNQALGAAHDPELVRRIGEATAQEMAVAGMEWTFGPMLTVPQDDRWGRSPEGYGEQSGTVAAMAAPIVEGLQGPPGRGTIQQGHVAASVKHFIADGGTTDGVDQGDAQVSEDALIATHLAGYPVAIRSGAMTVMASFSSWNGIKMHGNKSLLTDVLKSRLGFDGFVVGDWNGHGQIPGCTTTDCPQTFNAGLDMAMAPDSWKGLFDSTVAHVKAGDIPMARVDDAVRRILRVKAKLGLFDPARPLEAHPELMGSAAHRALAREAVAKSLILLKNNGHALPIRPGANVLVTGSHADDIGLQSGGWTLSWQGTGNTNADFPNGQSIWSGLRQAITATGGTATLSPDGRWQGRKPDVAIVVFGEQPYAELMGDIRTLEFSPSDKSALERLKALKAAGIPTVSVFISGRPLWVNPELNQSDAFVAALWPGTEGAGVADVLVAGKDGLPAHDFNGQLTFSWPKTAGQFALNQGKPGYDPLYQVGYGLSYARAAEQGRYGEAPGVSAAYANIDTYFVPGRAPEPWTLGTQGAVTMRNVDGGGRQEGARAFAWTGPGVVRVTGTTLDLRRQANAKVALRIDYRVDAALKGRVRLGFDDAARGVDATSLFAGPVGQWRTVKVSLACMGATDADLRRVTAPFALRADAPFGVSIVGLKLDADQSNVVCPK
ncbi:exo-1,4-beta-glucosidase [Sphingomonas gellani]|uniref:Exo-1,4-beta-glucosidase n=1 Tax=Sphingomonas gellani TaxID=1166340 RepID=A0A1H8J511_9SPHN|nr:glycoside hydrolase family 3 protein [Sphingomonas gellani]SEN75842.1 exo-1,4-beta-glucosidase [Sphingomonas gellani]